jgi:hypothetical protein
MKLLVLFCMFHLIVHINGTIDRGIQYISRIDQRTFRLVDVVSFLRQNTALHIKLWTL